VIGREHLKDLGIDGGNNTKIYLEETGRQGVVRVDAVAGSSGHINEPLCSMENRVYFYLF
jgi:hypothetical protein